MPPIIADFISIVTAMRCHFSWPELIDMPRPALMGVLLGRNAGYILFDVSRLWLYAS